MVVVVVVVKQFFSSLNIPGAKHQHTDTVVDDYSNSTTVSFLRVVEESPPITTVNGGQNEFFLTGSSLKKNHNVIFPEQMGTIGRRNNVCCILT